MRQPETFLRIITLTRKELSWYFLNPGGYLLIALFTGFSNFIFFKDFFINNQATLKPYFLVLPWFLIFFIAGISTRFFPEEKRGGTFEVVLSLPLSEAEIVLGKFLSSLIFTVVCFAGSGTLLVTTLALGKPDLGTFVAGYLGSSLLSAAAISIGLFISTLTRNQVVSLLSTILLLFSSLILGEDLVRGQLPLAVSSFVSLLGFIPHYLNFVNGVIDLRDVVFFLSITAGFIFLSIKIIENRD